MKIENENGIISVSLDDVTIDPFKLDEETREALMSGQEISEEQANKTVTIFEAAVNGKVSELREELQNQFNEALTEAVAEIQESTETNVSNYLKDVVVEEWMEQNKPVIEANVISENNGQIVEKLLAVLEEHYVTVPEDRRDLLEELGSENASLRDEVTTLEEQTIHLRNQMNGLACEAIIKTLSEDLAETEMEKFEKLVEDLSIDDPAIFEEKATVIHDTFFNKNSKKEAGAVVESKDAGAAEVKEELDNGKKQPSVIELAAASLRRRS